MARGAYVHLLKSVAISYYESEKPQFAWSDGVSPS